MPGDTFTLRLRRQSLEKTPEGYAYWKVHDETRSMPARECAVLLCDVWDTHPCRGAAERVAAMVPRMNAAIQAARARGALIVHAPSDTMPFYAEHPARKRALAAKEIPPPPERERDDPPLPFDPTKDCCDTDKLSETYNWTRQHPGIEIDSERDVIGDSGPQLLNVYAERGVKRLLIMGVHTGMCILRRSFAIKKMVRWGFEVALVRDLTDALYNPALPPYVSQREGTQLVIGYIEKFWCPSFESSDLIG
ncbi:MAG: isochorismatase family protein [Planctomycetota bacterium]|nr:isochorismatase family protein [Planctomycetota bacterium]